MKEESSQGFRRFFCNMTESEKYKQAYRFYNIGDKKSAGKIFVELAYKASNKVTKINSIFGAVTSLNLVENEKEILDLCEMGIDLAKKLSDPGGVAYLMALKANGLEMQATRYQHKRSSLQSALGWFEFALVRDAEAFEKLGQELQKTEEAVEENIKEALDLTIKAGRKDALANVLMIRGEINGGRYLTKKMGNIKHPRMFILCGKYHLEDLYFLLFEPERKIGEYIKNAEKDLIRSSELSSSLGDKQGEAYALFNLANQLRCARKFRSATKLLNRVEVIAQKTKNPVLLHSVKELRTSIKMRSRKRGQVPFSEDQV